MCNAVPVAQGASSNTVPNVEDLYQFFKKESTTDLYYTQFFKAGTLYSAVTSRDPLNQGMFYGYVVGVIDSLQAEGFEGTMLLHEQAVSLGRKFLDDEELNSRWMSWLREDTKPALMCIPASLEISEVFNIIIAYLETNKTSLPSMSARFAVRDALRAKGWHGANCANY
jgi:hypothetical protein